MHPHKVQRIPEQKAKTGIFSSLCADCGDLGAGGCDAGGGWRTGGLPLAEHPVQLSGVRPLPGGIPLPRVQHGSEKEDEPLVQGGGVLRGVLSAVPCPVHPRRAGVLRQCRQPLFPRAVLLYLHPHVLFGHRVSFGLHHRHGAGVSEPQPDTDLPPDDLSDPRDDHSGGTAGSPRHMAVRYPVVGAVFHLLQRDVESAGRPHRTAESEQLPEPYRRDALQQRGADGVRCGQLQADQRPLRPHTGGCLSGRDRPLHQKSLRPQRLLLPHWRRRVLRPAGKRRPGEAVYAGVCVPTGATAQGHRLSALGVLWVGSLFGRRYSDREEPGRPGDVPLQKDPETRPRRRPQQKRKRPVEECPLNPRSDKGSLTKRERAGRCQPS